MITHTCKIIYILRQAEKSINPMIFHCLILFFFQYTLRYFQSVNQSLYLFITRSNNNSRYRDRTSASVWRVMVLGEKNTDELCGADGSTTKWWRTSSRPERTVRGQSLVERADALLAFSMSSRRHSAPLYGTLCDTGRLSVYERDYVHYRNNNTLPYTTYSDTQRRSASANSSENTLFISSTVVHWIHCYGVVTLV